uniref:Protein kinase domain-containing protein n=1 Tax=Chromera velia CCMP2878 TaxID=1169474 RepID=A0A0G4HG40_9ALVE|eukprot:Cvel_27277.t1-p1 / transcript=Cvel_27277.t1 / gene=Cvel_27277 / organism=Chromera_velia_CCMP2878 / gene_product=Serine/threonine-protein kinase Aurora-3, putative / transcript_product=Serine/threonine-protein kinase Aurora-3, putative / location=Cvel_scaffold3378:2098-8881(-) / protein_length=557 / sequence_SO=supercontig / SO=protein_coding / is_pseudo=false
MFGRPIPPEKNFRCRKVTKKYRNEEGVKFIEEYQIGRVLGQGTFARVKSCVNTKDGKTYAVKIFRKLVLERKRDFSGMGKGGKPGVTTALHKVFREIEVMENLDHPRLGRSVDVLEHDDSQKLYVVMEISEVGCTLVWNDSAETYVPPHAVRSQNSHDCVSEVGSARTGGQGGVGAPVGADALRRSSVASEGANPLIASVTLSTHSQPLVPRTLAVPGDEGTGGTGVRQASLCELYSSESAGGGVAVAEVIDLNERLEETGVVERRTGDGRSRKSTFEREREAAAEGEGTHGHRPVKERRGSTESGRAEQAEQGFVQSSPSSSPPPRLVPIEEGQVVGGGGGGGAMTSSSSPGPVTATERERETILPEAVAACWARDAVEGLSHFHSKGFAHRDVKPENILVDREGRARVADFSAASKMDEKGRVFKTEGTYAFLSPESCAVSKEGEEYEGHDGPASDVWALGCTLYCFFYGRPPIMAENLKDLFDMLAEGQVELPPLPKISEEARDLLSRIFVKEPSKRITLEQMLNHDFLVKPKYEEARVYARGVLTRRGVLDGE